MVRYILAILLTIVFLLGCSVHTGYHGGNYTPPEKFRHYSPSGKYEGYTIKQENKFKHYDRMGGYKGYSIDRGNKVDHYDRMGKYKGYTKKN